MLLPLTMLNIRRGHLSLYIWVSLKGKATCIWSFGCDFTCAITMGCARFRLSFGMISIL